MSKKNKSLIENKKVMIDGKPSNQMTLDSLPEELLEKPKSLSFLKEDSEKQIIISSISLDLDIKNDEVTLKVDFSLLPSKVYFSKLKADLWFDGTKVKSVLFDIIHSFGSTDEFALKTTFEPSGVKPGTHLVESELQEISSVRKNLAYTVKETTVDYQPPNREERMKKVLTIKNVKGQGIAIISEKEKEVYREIEETRKKDLNSRKNNR